jgi:hypothetical protein
MSKNVLRLHVQLVDVDVIVCYGMKKLCKIAFKEYGDKITKDELSKYAGVCNTLELKGGGIVCLIGLDKGQSSNEIERIIVHELSHCVSDIMSEYGLECDETRSYMLDRLYSDVMKWYKKEIK